MPRRRVFLAALLLFFWPALAQAAGPVPFSAQAFAAAQAAGKPILVQIHADWCPTCAAQKPILAALERKPEFANLVVFNIDFDSQKDLVRKFGAQMQSTLIAFHGAKETGRSVGETDRGKIEALLETAEAG
ncbi:MAG TPA: thioredoxin family protein [Stellaceae bacterium]|nr:thioredoxin family protein [Stellaceae bacterium]